jgi:peptidoglycan/xylan/chitin deacetylase (PgdA/CDA1 family)
MKGRQVVQTDSRCLIVMYHYVRPLPHPGLPFFRAVTPERLKAQIELLAHEWTFISLDDYLEGLAGTRRLPDKGCILTFDDGLSDHYEYVLPVLAHYGISGAFFISSLPIAESYLLDVHMIQHLVARLQSKELVVRLVRAVRLIAPDSADQWLAPHAIHADRLYAYEPEPATRWAKYVMNFVLPEPVRRAIILSLFREEFGLEQAFGRRLYLSPEQVHQMAEQSMTIGSHGHRHIAMSHCTAAQKQAELQRSRALIEPWIRRSVSTFCYPWGGSEHIDEESEEVLTAQGFKAGLTTLDGVNEGSVSPFYLRRRDCIRIPGAI